MIGSLATANGSLTPTGTADSNAMAVQNAKADPFNPKASPVIPALVGLAICLWALHAVHFREAGHVSESEGE